MAETIGRFFVTPCKAPLPAISGGPPTPTAVSVTPYGAPPSQSPPSYGGAPPTPLTPYGAPRQLVFQGRQVHRGAPGRRFV